MVTQLIAAILPSQAIAEGGRKTLEIRGRNVTVARLGGRLYCFDSTCYHMGGPLEQGDIEDVGGVACVTCPWHNHKISLESGGRLEKGLMSTTCESAPQQRLHVAVDGSDGFIHVTLNDLRSLPSDKYNGQTFMYAQPAGQGFGLQHTGTGLHGFQHESRAFRGMTAAHQQSEQDEDEPMSLSQTDSETSEYTSAPSPLMPYAGFNRTAVSPSPVKRPQAEQLKFAQRKIIPFGRHAEARAAIFGKFKPPPVASAQRQRAPAAAASQPTLQDLWRQSALTQQETIEDMEF